MTDAQRIRKLEQALRLLLGLAPNLQTCIDNFDPLHCRVCKVIAFVQLRLIGSDSRETHLETPRLPVGVEAEGLR